MKNQISFHEAYVARGETRSSSDRAFGMVFTAVFSVIAFWPLLSGTSFRGWALMVAAVFLVIAVAKPNLLSPLNRLWTYFGICLNRIVNPIIMGFIFFFVVTPIGVTMRLFGKCPLDLDFDPNAQSYWIKRNPPGPTAETMRNQF